MWRKMPAFARTLSPILKRMPTTIPTNRRLAALAAICDTFLPVITRSDDPHGYWARSASDRNVPARILELLQSAKKEDQDEFNQLLGLLASPLLGITWLGPLKSADRLTPAQRETLLQRWATSPLPMLRNGFNALRKLTTILYYGDVLPAERGNPAWETIDYQQLNQHIRTDAAPLPVVQPTQDTTLTCDVLVIGSGSGGGVIAAQLAAAGQDVLVVEKGSYTQAHEFTQQEVPMMNRHFENGGLLTSQNGSITVLAGSTLGGGSTINWAGSLRTPDYVLEEWDKAHGNPHFTSTAYLKGFDFVEKRNSIRADFQHNPQNQSLLNAAHALGYRAEAIPMNLRFPEHLPAEFAWQATGFSCYGDAYGIKQGGVQTFLRDAVDHQARILPNANIEKITIENGQATGATGWVRTARDPVRVLIKAKRVVVAAGALHTPVLLLKSGLSHPQIGRNLFLHPVVAVPAMYPGLMRPWYGPMMSVIVQEFTRLHENWGVRIENPPIHPGLGAFSLSWENALNFKEDMANLGHLAVNISLVRDRFGGRVTVGRQSGQPVVHYNLHDFDRRHLIRGMEECVRLHHQAGAERISVLHNQPLNFWPQKESLQDFLPKIAAKKWATNWFSLFSAHQMGTCRMGGNRDYPVQPNGETREVRNLFVADASLFPAASGTNPMLSVQALSYHVAQGMS